MEIKIGDGLGTGKKAHLEQHNGTVGVVTYSDDLHIKSNLFVPALNDLYGSEMAQDASFGGTPVGIHNGTDTAYWTASTLSGTWDFSSATNPAAGSACIENVSNGNNEEALFTAAAPVDAGSYLGFSGVIRLEQWGGAAGTKHLELRFRLGGVDVGNSISLEDYIDTGLLNAYQSFGINLIDFGITNESIDELVILKYKDSGSSPHFRMDTLQLEETGGAISFVVVAPPHKKYIIKSLYLSYVDDLDISLLNNSAPALSYNKVLGENALTNGVNYQIMEDGVVVSSVSTKTIGDNLKSGANIVSLICDGTTTCLTLEVVFGGPLVLDSRYDDCLRITINDDLSGLISFSALSSGTLQAVSENPPAIREG